MKTSKSTPIAVIVMFLAMLFVGTGCRQEDIVVSQNITNLTPKQTTIDLSKNDDSVCVADSWSCADWGVCTTTGIQSRACIMTVDCQGVITPSPVNTRACTPPISLELIDRKNALNKQCSAYLDALNFKTFTELHYNYELLDNWCRTTLQLIPVRNNENLNTDATLKLFETCLDVKYNFLDTINSAGDEEKRLKDAPGFGLCGRIDTAKSIDDVTQLSEIYIPYFRKYLESSIAGDEEYRDTVDSLKKNLELIALKMGINVRDRAISCCKVCSVGKACGDTCISKDYECHQASGCACDQ